MNSSQEFIIQKLNELHFLFDTIKIRYEFRDYLNSHFIEILPLETFESNQDYISFEMQLECEFEEKFGLEEEILFISSESLNEIRNAQFSLGYDIQEKFTAFNLSSDTFLLNNLGS
jgi:hypothetical protein